MAATQKVRVPKNTPITSYLYISARNCLVHERRQMHRKQSLPFWRARTRSWCHATTLACLPCAQAGSSGNGDSEGPTIQMDIVVHAVGRSNFGCDWDTKGLQSPNVTLNGAKQHLPILSHHKSPALSCRAH